MSFYNLTSYLGEGIFLGRDKLRISVFNGIIKKCTYLKVLLNLNHIHWNVHLTIFWHRNMSCLLLFSIGLLIGISSINHTQTVSSMISHLSFLMKKGAKNIYGTSMHKILPDICRLFPQSFINALPTIKFDNF